MEELKNKIENLDKSHQIEILRIIKKGNSKLNSNKNGIYINLTFLSDDIINDIQAYLDYVEKQESIIQIDESKKDEYKHTLLK